MVEFEKYEKDGKVAVIYSPNFGAGWYTWNVDFENKNHYYGLLFDKAIVEMVLAGKRDQIVPYCECKYGKDGCYAGAEDLVLRWLDMGDKFRVQEYDGSESIELLHETIWLEA